jgi:hypothetical protein
MNYLESMAQVETFNRRLVADMVAEGATDLTQKEFVIELTNRLIKDSEYLSYLAEMNLHIEELRSGYVEYVTNAMENDMENFKTFALNLIQMGFTIEEFINLNSLMGTGFYNDLFEKYLSPVMAEMAELSISN